MLVSARKHNNAWLELDPGTSCFHTRSSPSDKTRYALTWDRSDKTIVGAETQESTAASSAPCPPPADAGGAPAAEGHRHPGADERPAAQGGRSSYARFYSTDYFTTLYY